MGHFLAKQSSYVPFSGKTRKLWSISWQNKSVMGHTSFELSNYGKTVTKCIAPGSTSSGSTINISGSHFRCTKEVTLGTDLSNVSSWTAARRLQLGTGSNPTPGFIPEKNHTVVQRMGVTKLSRPRGTSRNMFAHILVCSYHGGGGRAVWSESSLSAWRKLGSLATHWAHSEDADDLSLRWAHRSLCWFCHEAAHITVVLKECFWPWPFSLTFTLALAGTCSMEVLERLRNNLLYNPWILIWICVVCKCLS